MTGQTLPTRAAFGRTTITPGAILASGLKHRAVGCGGPTGDLVTSWADLFARCRQIGFGPYLFVPVRTVWFRLAGSGTASGGADKASHWPSPAAGVAGWESPTGWWVASEGPSGIARFPHIKALPSWVFRAGRRPAGARRFRVSSTWARHVPNQRRFGWRARDGCSRPVPARVKPDADHQGVPMGGTTIPQRLVGFTDTVQN